GWHATRNRTLGEGGLVPHHEFPHPPSSPIRHTVPFFLPLGSMNGPGVRKEGNMIKAMLAGVILIGGMQAGIAMAADAPHAVGIAGSAINVTDMDAQVKFYTEVVG